MLTAACTDFCTDFRCWIVGADDTAKRAKPHALPGLFRWPVGILISALGQRIYLYPNAIDLCIVTAGSRQQRAVAIIRSLIRACERDPLAESSANSGRTGACFDNAAIAVVCAL